MLAALLSDHPHLPQLNPASVGPGVSSLAVDYATPQFSESVPRLFARYLSAMATGSHALEYTRFLLMYVLFRRILEVSSRFSNTQWLDLVQSRVEAMTISFEFWQIALRFPSLEPPPSSAISDSGITKVIDDAHASSLEELAKVRARAKRRLGFPPVFACGSPSTDVKTTPLSPDIIPARDVAFMPGTSDKMLILGGGEGRLFRFQNGVWNPYDGLTGVVAVIVHPTFPMFIVLGGDSAKLYHFDQEEIDRYSFTGGRPTCGAFSPTGSKFALCGDAVNIYSFDLTKKDHEPAIHRELKGQVTAVAWLNSDTMLAIAIGGNLLVVDTFSRYHIPIEFRKEWGMIMAMTIEAKSGRILCVTKGGFLVVMDFHQSYAQSYPRNWVQGPINFAAVSSAAEMVVFSFDRNIFLFHMADPQTVADLHVPPEVRAVSSVAIVEDRIAATADPGRLILWGAQSGSDGG